MAQQTLLSDNDGGTLGNNRVKINENFTETYGHKDGDGSDHADVATNTDKLAGIDSGAEVNSVGIYSKTITDADVTGGICAVTHGLGNAHPLIDIWKGTTRMGGIPIESTGDNTLEINFGGSISVTYYLTVIG